MCWAKVGKEELQRGQRAPGSSGVLGVHSAEDSEINLKRIEKEEKGRDRQRKVWSITKHIRGICQERQNHNYGNCDV